MGRIIHVEIVAEDHDRAAAFYTKVFGWAVTPAPVPDGYLLARTGAGEGIDGAIISNRYQTQPTIAWIEVDDLEATLEAARAAGGRPVGDIQELPGIGRLSYLRDTEGVLIGVRAVPKNG
ncbi:putative enzyme related to lactoylglutathione lyase [Kribbella aluminosa]|uniref:Enzyme related to lactoylglutathione lyase n=1 Tax=Kribbella aluminosa TaxID=416017 RepID=A0ABS4UF85_9ACTN|nr:VOC family protein [Kribbella aluminosa]MBP2350309.1 putative enzyme related to lactoylglutathione lyase [Kribbella aluminosa]